jgi:hypothetical protein
MSRIPFSAVTRTVEPGFITPPPKNPKTGRVDTIPDSAANAAVVESPTAVDLAQAAVPSPPRNSPARRALLPELNVAKAEGSGRKRKSKKSKRKTRKYRARHTRRR